MAQSNFRNTKISYFFFLLRYSGIGLIWAIAAPTFEKWSKREKWAVVRNWAQREANGEVTYEASCIERGARLRWARKGVTHPQSLCVLVWPLAAFPATFSPYLGIFPQSVWIQDCKEQFLWDEGAEGHPTTAAPAGRGEAISARRGGTTNEMWETLQHPCKYFPHLRADSAEWKVRNFTFFFFLRKNPPVSMPCLPRGSSNSSPWPPLLNFPLYNLLNSRISMVTRARYWYASNILYIFAGEMQTQSRSCTTARSNNQDAAEPCAGHCSGHEGDSRDEPRRCFVLASPCSGEETSHTHPTRL